MHAGAVGAGGEEGLAGGVFLLAPGVDEALRVDFEAFGVRVVGEGDAGVGAHEAPRGLEVRVDVDRLVEVETAIDAPMQRVDDVVGVFGAEAAQHDAAIGEHAVGVRVREMQEFGAGADVDAAEVVRRDAGGDEQAVRDDAGDVGHAVTVRVFQEDDLVVAGGRTELGGVAGHLRGEVLRIDLRVGVGGRDPQAAGGIPVHVHRLLEERVLGEERDAQAVGQFELRGGQGGAHFELRRCLRFGRQRARLAGGDGDGVGFGRLDQRIELRDLDGVVALFALTEAEDVGVVGRAAAVEKERVLAEDRGAQGFGGRGGLVPGCLVHFPAELGGDAFAERAVATLGQVDAVVGAEVEGDALALPFRLDERHVLLGGEFSQAAAISGEQGVMLGGVGQAGAGAAEVFVGDRAEDDEAYLAAGGMLGDQLHQLGDFALQAGRRVFGAVAGRVRIEGRVVLAIGEFFERSGHAVTDDRDGRLHDGELLLELFDALGDRIEAGAGGAEGGVAGVAEITHGEFLAGEFLAHLRLEHAVVVFALHQHVADEQDAVTVVERELAAIGGTDARLVGDEGTECQQGGEAGHGGIGRRIQG